MASPQTTVNIEAKNGLARLLATENIWIQHRQVKTASFDTVKRILTFPIWKDMKDVVYTMLAAHEVGHALWTDRESLAVIAKRIDEKNYKIAATYVNIVEDARIERMIKALYPGLKVVFSEAYKELLEQKFFGDLGKDPNQRAFIDRINLYFKVGHHLNLKFTPDEQVLVNKVENTMTFGDVFAVAKEIYEYAQKHETQPEPEEFDMDDLLEKIKNGEVELVESDEDSESGEDGNEIEVEIGDSEDSDSDEGEDSKDGSGGDGDEDSDGEADESGDGGDGDEGDEGEADGKGKDSDKDKPGEGDEKDKQPGDGDGKEKEGKDKGGKQKVGGKPGTGKKALKPVDPGPPPEPTTQNNFDENVTKLNDTKAADIVYVTIPKPNLDSILTDYKSVHSGIRSYFADKLVPGSIDIEEDVLATGKSSVKVGRLTKTYTISVIEKAERAFQKFRADNQPKVNYIYQQFELKKQADRYKRTRVHKTGSLDPLRLYDYKTAEDIFKTIAIVADGRNHGLIFIVDWSASMSGSMAGTLEQLIVLCLFCIKANIPYEVYSFTTGNWLMNAFSKRPGDLCYAQNFKMRNYLSSRMTMKEFNDACVNLFMLMPDGDFAGGPTLDNLIGCTPLDEAIITTIDLMKVFRGNKGAQVVNAIFLTDSGANTVNGYLDSRGHSVNMYGNVKFLIDDRLTHRVYDFSKYSMTKTLLCILRDRQNINVVGFFIGGRWEHFFDVDDVKREELKRQFDEDGYVIATDAGYSELYITKAGDALRVKEVKVSPIAEGKGTDAYVDKLTENFIKQSHAVSKQRLMLNRFVTMIA